MQPEKIILLPPTHEQTTPSFHIEGRLADGFLDFLKSRGVDAWQPPQELSKEGPDGRRVVEVEIEAGTPMDRLEALKGEFLRESGGD